MHRSGWVIVLIIVVAAVLAVAGAAGAASLMRARGITLGAAVPNNAQAAPQPFNRGPAWRFNTPNGGQNNGQNNGQNPAPYRYERRFDQTPRFPGYRMPMMPYGRDGSRSPMMPYGRNGARQWPNW